MSSAVRKSVRDIFDEILKRTSNLKRVLNMSEEGASQRVFPPRAPKNNEAFGIRLDKGETVKGKPGHVRLKLQANRDAKN